MPFVLPELPWSMDALAPHISAETLSFHHGRHHASYVENLNTLLWGRALADAALADLIRRIDEVDVAIRQKVLDAAGQHLNHSFYWQSLRPASRRAPGGALLAAIGASFGSVGALKAAFTKECVGHFGSGWGWLVKEDDGTLKVVTTHDAGTPPVAAAPLLVCDVWEHAYYIDRRNDRAAYLRSFWEVADWEFAERNFVETRAPSRPARLRA
jgi:superoxide dismutase, Fe-Mn family